MSFKSSMLSLILPPTFREFVDGQTVLEHSPHALDRHIASLRSIHALKYHCHEGHLINKINVYADRRTLLTKRWRSERSVKTGFKYQELTRLEADTEENRQAFYTIVTGWRAWLGLYSRVFGQIGAGHRSLQLHPWQCLQYG